MARNDGIDRTSVRNLAVSDKAVGNTQQHNEREKDSYRNPDIIPQRAAWNVHFKKPTAATLTCSPNWKPLVRFQRAA